MHTMNQAAIDEFNAQGFVVIESILDPERDIPPLEIEYGEQLDEMIDRAYADGKISSKFKGLPLGKRAAAAMAAGLSLFPDFDISLPSKITPETEMHLGPAVFDLLRNQRLLDAMEALIGPEIYCNPVQHVRIKPPESGVPKELRSSFTASVGWHQDAGVVLSEADATETVSVWLAITDVGVENSCLYMMPGSHKGELAVHCFDTNKNGFQGAPAWEIPDKFRAPESVPVPMHKGDAVFFHRKTMHSSGPNVSNDWRWSFDLRYNPIGMPTGRSWFPGFVARSRANPETELTDAAQWKEMWLDARDRLLASQMPEFLRWQKDDPRCA